MLKLSQVESTHILYLRPNANGCNIDFTPIGDTNNYLCIDDYHDLPDDDETYVMSKSSDSEYDMYDIQNTSETGIIEYVQICTRAKSHIDPQQYGGIFKILVSDDNCSNIYKTDNIEITTSYQNYYWLLNENPRTSTTWTFDELNNLQIGVECNSPVQTSLIKILTLRPNGDYNVPSDHWSKYPNIDNYYDKIDETSSNEDIDYIYRLSDVAWKECFFNVLNHTTETGTINYITLVWKAKAVGSNPYNALATHCIAVKTNGGYTTYYKSGYYHMSSIYASYIHTWNVNPNTDAAWTWDDIDNIKCGVYAKAGTNQQIRITQLYLIVNYTTPTYQPEIRTTQEYARIKYTKTSEAYLQNPNEIELDQKQIVVKMNMWSGNRIVFGEKRGNLTMLLTGDEWNTDTINAEDRIDAIRDMAKKEEEIIVETSGLSSKVFDGTYRLSSFGWKKICECPKHYQWQLELEALE